jgi:hypothetical protein
MSDDKYVQQGSGLYIGLRVRYLATFSVVFMLLLVGLYVWFYQFGMPQILQHVMTAYDAGAGVTNVQIDQSTVSIIRENFVRALEFQVWQNVSQAGLGVLVAFFFVNVGVISLANAFAHRNIGILTAAAREVTAGHFNIDLSRLHSGRFRSEISELARAVEESGQAHLREQKLLVVVAELKIEIDHLRRKAEVNAIIETDSFKELRRRANELRRETAEADNPPETNPA